MDKGKLILKLKTRILTPGLFEYLWESLYEKYKDETIGQFSRIIGHDVSLNKQPGTINVMGIRYNDEVAFNDDRYNNDLFVVYENTTNGRVRLYVFDCTLDPKSKKNRIAHLAKGIYRSYTVRNHRWIPGRTALGQDINPVNVIRTDSDGNVIEIEQGFFGINVHDSAGYWNTSLGCTVIPNNYKYTDILKPLLLRIKKIQPVICYCVTSISDVGSLLDRVDLSSVEPKPISVWSEIKPTNI